MKILLNGKFFVDSSLDYDKIHKLVNDNSYNSIGDAIHSKITDAIQQTEWFHHQPQNFDLVHNFNQVQAQCGEDTFCYMDSLNWAIMNKSELTADIYKFITHRTAIMRDGIENNLIPHNHIDFSWFNLPELIPNLLNSIDWQFVLDCVSWFF